MNLSDIVKMINADIENNRLFWAAGLIRETQKALWAVRHELHPAAQVLLTKYHNQTY